MNNEAKIAHFRETFEEYKKDYPNEYLLGELLSAMALMQDEHDRAGAGVSDLALQMKSLLEGMANAGVSWTRIRHLLTAVANSEDLTAETRW